MARPGELCVLSKQVHASERQWARLVIPGAQVKFFTAMQAEIKAQGHDMWLYLRDPDGAHTWRWGCRMTVQRPMILDMAAFYSHHQINAGDTISVWRHQQTNVLTVELLRGTGPPPVDPTAGPSALAAAAPLPPFKGPPVAVPDFAPGQLPGQIWAQGPRGGGGKPSGAGGHGTSAAKPAAQRRPNYDVWDTQEGWDEGGDGDEDYSPTAAGRKRSGAGRGPHPVRRTLHKEHRADPDADSASDQESSHNYTAEQMTRFDMLVDVAARLSQPPEGGP